ncbi:hypothetical protein Tco_0039289 [Tanacetum coccineum]
MGTNDLMDLGYYYNRKGGVVCLYAGHLPPMPSSLWSQNRYNEGMVRKAEVTKIKCSSHKFHKYRKPVVPLRDNKTTSCLTFKELQRTMNREIR